VVSKPNAIEKELKMPTTLEELEQRVVQMESELTRLRQLVEKPLHDEAPAERGARLLAQARRDKARLQRSVERAFEEMGIQAHPVSPEKLREMMAADGVKPEDNLFSQGIKEMREE
jgi:hypothetical protein